MYVSESGSVYACKRVCFGKMCSPTPIPLPALDGGIGTVCYHGDWPHNGYHGNMRERQRCSSGCQGDRKNEGGDCELLKYWEVRQGEERHEGLEREKEIQTDEKLKRGDGGMDCIDGKEKMS